MIVKDDRIERFGYIEAAAYATNLYFKGSVLND